MAAKSMIISFLYHLHHHSFSTVNRITNPSTRQATMQIQTIRAEDPAFLPLSPEPVVVHRLAVGWKWTGNWNDVSAASKPASACPRQNADAPLSPFAQIPIARTAGSSPPIKDMPPQKREKRLPFGYDPLVVGAERDLFGGFVNLRALALQYDTAPQSPNASGASTPLLGSSGASTPLRETVVTPPESDDDILWIPDRRLSEYSSPSLQFFS